MDQEIWTHLLWWWSCWFLLESIFHHQFNSCFRRFGQFYSERCKFSQRSDFMAKLWSSYWRILARDEVRNQGLANPGTLCPGWVTWCQLRVLLRLNGSPMDSNWLLSGEASFFGLVDHWGGMTVSKILSGCQDLSIVFLMFLKLMRITFTADKDKFSTQEDEMRFSRWILSSNGGIIEEYSEGLFGGLPVMEIA